MHGFWDYEVLLQDGYDVLCQGVLYEIFHDWFWKTNHDFMILIHINFLAAVHGFRDNEVLLPTAYDVIVIPPPGALFAIFHEGFWTSDHDFLIAFHGNFSAVMHDFRDNEVLLHTRFDVIMFQVDLVEL